MKALVARARTELAQPEPEGPMPLPADGEVAELVAWLRAMADDAMADDALNSADYFTRAADLLERLAPQLQPREHQPAKRTAAASLPTPLPRRPDQPTTPQPMTRSITEHQVNSCNEEIAITVLDEPGSGGASHLYELRLCDEDSTLLSFQNGPIAEVGVNGITHEALLAVLIDRLRGFQSGPFSCRENAIALTKLEEAQMWLHRRTAQRIERGVEGTHQL